MSISMQITNEAFRLKLQYASTSPEKLEKLVSGRQDTAAFQIIINSDLQYSLTAHPVEWFSQSSNHTGYNGKVMLSLRYKNFQRGIYDYEMLEQIRRKKGNAVADALIEKVFFPESLSALYPAVKVHPEKFFTSDWKCYNELKAEMLTALE